MTARLPQPRVTLENVCERLEGLEQAVRRLVDEIQVDRKNLNSRLDAQTVEIGVASGVAEATQNAVCRIEGLIRALLEQHTEGRQQRSERPTDPDLRRPTPPPDA